MAGSPKQRNSKPIETLDGQRYTNIAALAFSVKCPICYRRPGARCKTRFARGYHIRRTDKAVAKENRERYGKARPNRKHNEREQ
jgi:hypothetical protein